MNFRELFRAEQLPVFQNKMFETAEAAQACPKGDVVLVQDMDTGLVFNAAFNPDLLVYDADYQNEQAHSVFFQKHLEDVTSIIERYFHEKSLIEVGCGKGYFLEHLKKSGYQVVGIDPAYEGNNPDVIVDCFEPELGITADGVILRHVLEHMVNPVDFLHNVAEANGGSGLIYIEVPCFDWICQNRAWFDVFYEHVNYFRLADFDRIFENVVESGHVFGGQYLYVIADLASLRPPRIDAGDELIFPHDFLSDIGVHSKRINFETGKQNAIWGGASKGVIFSLYMERAGTPVDMVIDINPAKQGKYMAATGLQILSPELAMQKLLPEANMFILNSNYLDEIVRQSKNLYTYIKVDHYEL